MEKKTTDVTAAEAIAEVKGAAEKAGEATKKAVKKTASKAKKTVAAAKEAGEAAVKKTTRRKKALAPAVAVQSVLGGEIDVEEVISRVNAQLGTKAYENFNIYIKPEENKAFYVADGAEGFVELW